MKRIILVLLGLTVFVVSSCQQMVDTTADVESFQRRLDELGYAYNNKDLDALVACYTDDAVRMSADEPVWIGMNAIRTGFQKGFEMYDEQAKDIVEDVRVFGDLACLRGTWIATLNPKDAEETISESGKWMSLMQRQSDGSWKTVWDIWNRDHPAKIQLTD